jgi:hypothetical protein
MSATSRSLDQRSPILSARVLECDLVASMREGLYPKMGRRAIGKYYISNVYELFDEKTYNMGFVG